MSANIIRGFFGTTLEARFGGNVWHDVGFGGIHSWGYYFWDKGLKDYVAVDLGVYHDLLLFDQ
jgi:hypothetical protein